MNGGSVVKVIKVKSTELLVYAAIIVTSSICAVTLSILFQLQLWVAILIALPCGAILGPLICIIGAYFLYRLTNKEE